MKNNRKKIFGAMSFIVLFVVLCVFGARQLLGCCIRNEIYDSHVRSTLSSKFSDFSSVKDDFYIVSSIVIENKPYLMNMKYSRVNIIVYDNKVKLSTDEYDIDISEKEQKAAINVYYAFMNEGVNDVIDSVSFLNDTDLLFCCDRGNYGIVYSPNDAINKSSIEKAMGQNAGVVKLADCWYQVIRL